MLALLLLGLALLTPWPAAAQQEARLLDQSVAVQFPTTVTFRLRAQSPIPITKAEVRFATQHRSCAPVETSGFAGVAPSTDVDASWTWDLRTGGILPPGTVLRYHWLLWDAEGLALDTPWQTLQVQDDLHPWQSRWNRDNAIDLYWYDGDDAFAGALMDSAQQAIARLDALAQIGAQGPIRIYVYATGDDLRDALVFPEPWAGGQAFGGYDTIAIGIAPASLGWGVRAIAHEVTHVLLDQAVFNCFSDLPAWLNEGLATYNEDATGEPSSGYAEPLKEGLRTGRLLSAPGISASFPTDAGDALLAYGQSNSLVAYLLKTYGNERLRLLLAAFRQGMDADAALTAVYGFDQAGLDALWRTYVGAPPRPGDAPPLLPLPTPVLPAFEPYALGTPEPDISATPAPQVTDTAGGDFLLPSAAVRSEPYKSSWIETKPFDWVAILSGALLGGFVGLGLVYLIDWLSRPKVGRFELVRDETFNLGTLYKLQFTLKGRAQPGTCALSIGWKGHSVFAKWDETPNPLENDDPTRFRPELVPSTYYQPLFLNKIYRVPVIIKSNIKRNQRDEYQVFSAWWFGWARGYGSDPSLQITDQITLTLSGGTFTWSKTFPISDIVKASPAEPDHAV